MYIYNDKKNPIISGSLCVHGAIRKRKKKKIIDFEKMSNKTKYSIKKHWKKIGKFYTYKKRRPNRVRPKNCNLKLLQYFSIEMEWKTSLINSNQFFFSLLAVCVFLIYHNTQKRRPYQNLDIFLGFYSNNNNKKSTLSEKERKINVILTNTICVRVCIYFYNQF